MNTGRRTFDLVVCRTRLSCCTTDTLDIHRSPEKERKKERKKEINMNNHLRLAKLNSLIKRAVPVALPQSSHRAWQFLKHSTCRQTRQRFPCLCCQTAGILLFISQFGPHVASKTFCMNLRLWNDRYTNDGKTFTHTASWIAPKMVKERWDLSNQRLYFNT